MRRDRRNSLFTIAFGAIITAVALLMFSVAYPQLFALFSMLAFVSVVILALSMLAYVPRIPSIILAMIRETERRRKEKWLADINEVRRKMGLRPLEKAVR